MKTLILVVDIDDDFGSKAKVRGPVVGERAIVNAATKLALSDPEDADSNAAFKAVKLYRQLKSKGKKVEVALLTGSKKLGIEATQRVAQQLDIVLKKFKADSTILVTDGMADEVILPLIESRIKLDAVDIVYVKQAKELEKTYFLILEKLRDPAYAKTIFGIPAILLLLLSVMYAFNIPWQFLGFMLGLYLLVKGFGLEDSLYGFLSSSIELPESIRSLVVVILVLFLITAGGVAYLEFQESTSNGFPTIIAYLLAIDVLVNFLSLFVVVALVLKATYNYFTHNFFRVLSSLNSFISIASIIVVVKVILRWIINIEPPFFGFGDVIYITLGVVLIAYIIHRYIDNLKKTALASGDIAGFEVYTSYGDYVGIADSVKGENIIIKSSGKKKESIPTNKVLDVFSNRIIVK